MYYNLTQNKYIENPRGYIEDCNPGDILIWPSGDYDLVGYRNLSGRTILTVSSIKALDAIEILERQREHKTTKG